MAALGIKRPWTPDEDAAIRAQWGTRSQREIGELIGRNHADVSRRGREIGLPARYQQWTAAEDAVLRASYRSTPVRVLARRMGRSTRAIESRAAVLGVQVYGGRGRQRA